MFKSTSSFFRDTHVRGPGDFGPKAKKTDNQQKPLRIKTILKERTSRTGTVWVTAEVHKKKGLVYGVLRVPTDREWMIEVREKEPTKNRKLRKRTGRKVRIRQSLEERDR
ncbi:MAG: hypothetical protein V1792_21650 [Pseudomonadota bacterium]